MPAPAAAGDDQKSAPCRANIHVDTGEKAHVRSAHPHQRDEVARPRTSRMKSRRRTLAAMPEVARLLGHIMTGRRARRTERCCRILHLDLTGWTFNFMSRSFESMKCLAAHRHAGGRLVIALKITIRLPPRAHGGASDRTLSTLCFPSSPLRVFSQSVHYRLVPDSQPHVPGGVD